MLHESVQRRVCRIAFVAACVLPTLLVGCFVVRIWLPAYARHWELPLGQFFDCSAAVEGLRLPRPGIARFERLILSDPETGATWLTLNDVSHELRHGQIYVRVERAELDSFAVPEFSDRIERMLRRVALREMNLAVAEVVLLRNDAAWKAANVRVSLTQGETARCLQAWSDSNSSGPRLRVERDKQLRPPATQITFQTGSEPLPCWVIAFFDPSGLLGPEALFEGRLDMIASRDALQGNLSGRFSRLSASPELFIGELPAAQLDVKDLRWNDGMVSAPGGPSSLEPAAALVAQIQLAVNPQLRDSTTDFSAPSGGIDWELGPLQSWPQAVKVADEHRLMYK